MVQTNLGIALLALGERENNTARLEEARDAFSGALGQYQKANMPYADVVHGHLASVEARLRDRPNK